MHLANVENASVHRFSYRSKSSKYSMLHTLSIYLIFISFISFIAINLSEFPFHMPDHLDFPRRFLSGRELFTDHRPIQSSSLCLAHKNTRRETSLSLSIHRNDAQGTSQGIGARVRKTESVGGPVPFSLSSAVADISRAVPREELRVLVPRRSVGRKRERERERERHSTVLLRGSFSN